MTKRRILIIDDDVEFLEELKEALVLSGYDILAVSQAKLALDIAIREKPDLVLLDLKMPDKSGFQVAGELRHVVESLRTPIIAMTGYFKDDYVPLMNLCGIKRCLKKPFNPLDVISIIEEELLGG